MNLSQSAIYPGAAAFRVLRILASFWVCLPGMLSAEIAQQAYLKARNGEEGDMFGGTVAISGNTLVAAAWNRYSVGSGVDGDESVIPLGQRAAVSQGAAYVFIKLSEGIWVQQAYLRGIGPSQTAFVGQQLAIDGDLVVLAAYASKGSGGAAGTGVVDIFSRSEGIWQAEARLEGTDSGENFGISVALSGDTLAVGSRSAVKVFKRRKDDAPSSPTGHSWFPQAVLKAGEPVPNARYNASLRGNLIAMCYAGAAYVYDRIGEQWTLQGRLSAPSDQNLNFTNSVTNGKLIVAASALNGKTSLWGFHRQGTEWKYYRTVARNTPGFGRSIALSNNSLLVGAPDTNNITPGPGVAFLYRLDALSWDTPLSQLKPNNSKPGDWFGYSVSLDGDQAAIGAPKEDRHPRPVTGGPTQLFESGAAYVFNTWLAKYSLTDCRKEGNKFILNFSGTPEVTDWVIKGSSDPSVFVTDMIPKTVITENPPGAYKAVVDVSEAGPRYFLKLEHD